MDRLIRINRWLWLTGALILLPLASIAQATSVPVIRFGDLEKMLYQRDDTTYVINFWATWCAPCIKEIPHFLEVEKEMRDNKLRMVLISLDNPKDLQNKVLPFVENRNITVPVYLLDEPNYNQWMPKVYQTWSGAIPATLIYLKNKRRFYEKPLSKEELVKAINQVNKR